MSYAGEYLHRTYEYSICMADLEMIDCLCRLWTTCSARGGCCCLALPCKTTWMRQAVVDPLLYDFVKFLSTGTCTYAISAVKMSSPCVHWWLG